MRGCSNAVLSPTWKIFFAAWLFDVLGREEIDVWQIGGQRQCSPGVGTICFSLVSDMSLCHTHCLYIIYTLYILHIYCSGNCRYSFAFISFYTFNTPSKYSLHIVVHRFLFMRLLCTMLHTEFHNATIICIASTVCPEHTYTCVTSLWLLYSLSFKYVVRQASFAFHGYACLRVVRCIRPTRPVGDTKANIWAWNQHFAIGTIRQMARAPILPVWLWKERKYFTMYRIYFLRGKHGGCLPDIFYQRKILQSTSLAVFHFPACSGHKVDHEKEFTSQKYEIYC